MLAPVIHVLVVIDVHLYAEGLRRLLATCPQVQVVGVAESRREALALVSSLDPSPDVALLGLPVAEALACLPALHAVASQLKVVPLGLRNDDDDVVHWAEAGASGFVHRGARAEELLLTIESVARGEMVCSPRAIGTLLRRVGYLADRRGEAPARPSCALLTSREREVARLVGEGLSNKEIASRLRIGVPTVKNHVHRILEKVGARRRGEAAALLRDDLGDVRVPAAR